MVNGEFWVGNGIKLHRGENMKILMMVLVMRIAMQVSKCEPTKHL